MSVALPLVTHEEFIPDQRFPTGDHVGVQAMCQAMHNCFFALGWRQTEDTGQLSIPLAMHPGSSSGSLGYEIWRSQDDASMNVPVPMFIRIEYLIHSYFFQAFVSVGTATNGAGVVSAAPGHAFTVPSSVSPIFRRTTTAADPATSGGYIRATGNSGCIIMSTYARGGNQNKNGGLFYLERCLNSDGSPNQYGAYFFSYGTLSPAWASVVTNRSLTLPFHSQANAGKDASSGGPCYTGHFGGAMDTAISSTMVDGTIYAYPVFTGFYGGLGGVSRIAIGVNGYDVPANTVFSTEHYGSIAQFAAIGVSQADDTASYCTRWADNSSSAYWCRPAMLIVGD